MRRFPITLTGMAAKRALASECKGRVLAVFRRSFYLEFFSGMLACLGPSSIGLGPLIARCEFTQEIDWTAGGLRTGAPFYIEREHLTIDSRYLFDMTGAREWRPSGMPSECRPADLPRGISALRRKALKFAPDEGFGRLIPFLLGQSFESVKRKKTNESFTQHAQIGIDGLRTWLESVFSLHGPEVRPPVEVERLLGLGSGLTPSGDDFLGGAMIALHALGHGASAGRLAAWTLPRARGKTSLISFAHLSCAASGEGAEALHITLCALIKPENDGLDKSLMRLSAIGHTSGWDALAGAALVFTVKAGI